MTGKTQRVVIQMGKTTLIVDEDKTYRLSPATEALNAPFQVGDHFAWVVRVAESTAGFVPNQHAAHVGRQMVVYGTVEEVRGDHVVGRCFSALCRTGAVGETAIASITVRLSESEFAYAKDYGWPNDMVAQRCVRQGVAP